MVSMFLRSTNILECSVGVLGHSAGAGSTLFRRCSRVFRCSINVTCLLHIPLLRILLFLWCFNVPRVFRVTLFCVSAFSFLHCLILQGLPCLGRSLGKFTYLSGGLYMGTALLLVNVFKIKITL